MNKAIFLDRDGVLNYNSGYPFRTSDFRLIDGVAETLREAQLNGYHLYIVTNQSAIARGFCTLDQVKIFNQFLINELSKHQVMINGLKFCPHHPEAQVKEYRMSCNCRKPNPGMIEELCELHSIEPGLSFMIGDSETDVSAGKAAKLKESFLIPSNKAGALENCITNILQYTN